MLTPFSSDESILPPLVQESTFLIGNWGMGIRVLFLEVPPAQNNQHAKVACFGVTCSDPFQWLAVHTVTLCLAKICVHLSFLSPHRPSQACQAQEVVLWSGMPPRAASGCREMPVRNVTSECLATTEAVADAIRISLGPKGMDKIIPDGKGKVTNPNDVLLKQRRYVQ